MGSVEYGDLGPRFLAFLIDAGILMALILLPMAVSFGVSMAMGDSVISLIVSLLMWAVVMVVSLGYQLYFNGTKGATPGKKMMKLRVALLDGQWPIGYGKAFVRMLAQSLSGICMIGYIMIFLDKEKKQALHDKLAGTIVIKAQP